MTLMEYINNNIKVIYYNWKRFHIYKYKGANETLAPPPEWDKNGRFWANTATGLQWGLNHWLNRVAMPIKKNNDLVFPIWMATLKF